MTRKKHTHQTKSEAHAEVLAEAPAPHAEAAAAAPAPTAHGRFEKLLRSAEALAKTRLSGTRVELLLDGVPARLEKALDAALDRVGLVRKSKLPGAPRAASASMTAEAQPAE